MKMKQETVFLVKTAMEGLCQTTYLQTKLCKSNKIYLKLPI